MQVSRDIENQNFSSKAKEAESKTVEELPLESSPYVKYSDLEDYKRQAYGTDGHLTVNPNQLGISTDAPTLSTSDTIVHPSNPQDIS